MKLNTLTITQAQQGLRAKEFSSHELTLDCLAAITEKNPVLNAYREVFDDAGEQAREADAVIASVPPGKLAPLIGIPLALKDNMLLKGRRISAGSRMLENYTATYDSTVADKLKKSGAVLLGVTNMDEFAMGSSTETSAFGITRNPHDTERVPGGSSGGSAAAVAAHCALAALGSDTGGSIRQPASFTGIVGLKPTYGAVSRHGLIAMASSLDQIGPMTKSVQDARILFSAIAGKDNFDSTVTPEAVYPANNQSRSNETPPDLKNIRIGVPQEYFSDGLAPTVRTVIEKSFKKFEQAGAILVPLALPHSRYALPAYYIIVPSEVSANLARFDGVRYGLSSPNASTLLETYQRSRGKGFGTEVKRRIMLGTYALSAGYYDAYYLKAQKIRTLIRDDFVRAFATVDVIAGPTTPTPAFALGEHSNNPLEMYLADIYTVAINLAGLPALSLPAGTVPAGKNKLPVGLQVIAPWFMESKLFNIAAAMELLLN